MARAHVEDTGAAFPGAYFSDPYDVHSEGLLVPGVKVFEQGREQRDIMRLIFNNVRLAEGVRNDSYAMIAATKLAEDRLSDLIAKYGIDTVQTCVAVMQARTEQAVRASIRAIPDGTYYGESATDDDGVELDVPVTVRCEVTVSGDRHEDRLLEKRHAAKGLRQLQLSEQLQLRHRGGNLFFDPALAEYHNEGTMRADRRFRARRLGAQRANIRRRRAARRSAWAAMCSKPS